MEVKIDDEILESLLYMSQLTATTEEATALIEQIKSVISDMDVLRSYLSEYDMNSATIDEQAFRGSDVGKALEAKALKQNSNEFLDGYFRVPKILGSN